MMLYGVRENKCLEEISNVTDFEDEIENLNKQIAFLNACLKNTADSVEFQKNDAGTLYYLDDDGNRLTGEQFINGVPYLFADDGALRTQWQMVNGRRYYYDPGTGNVVLGWMDWHGDTYYITLAEGKYESTTRIIDGKKYTFDNYGVATEVGTVAVETTTTTE